MNRKLLNTAAFAASATFITLTMATFATAQPNAGARGSANPPRVDIEISLPSVFAGETATLRWSANGAEWCRALHGWSGNKGLEGEQQVGPLKQAGKFGLECGNDAGKSSDTTTYKLVDRPRGMGGGRFDIGCNFSHALPDDPIVFPNQPGASHLHDFFGFRGTDAFSTPEQMRRAIENDPSATTCTEQSRKEGGPPAANGSGYWAPSIYVNGKKINPDHVHIYYRNERKQPLTAFPADFRMIAGDKGADPEEAKAARVIKWWCGNIGGSRVDVIPPDCEGKGGIHAGIVFPACWNGEPDSRNHQDHLSYPNDRNNCPASHPINLPRIVMHITYNVYDQTKQNLRLSDKLVIASGGMWTMHADYLFAWDPFRLDMLVHGCLNAKQDCRRNPPDEDGRRDGGKLGTPPQNDGQKKEERKLVVLGQSAAAPRAGESFSLEFGVSQAGERLPLTSASCFATLDRRMAKIERKQVNGTDAACSWRLPGGEGGTMSVRLFAQAKGGYVQKRFDVQVAPGETKDGGGSAGLAKPKESGPSSRPKVQLVRTSPEAPRAGESFSISFAVVKGEERQALERVTCLAIVNGRIAKLDQKELEGDVATCTWQVPEGAQGGTLRASLSGRTKAGYAYKSFRAKVG
jgi:hypothetical protein